MTGTTKKLERLILCCLVLQAVINGIPLPDDEAPYDYTKNAATDISKPIIDNGGLVPTEGQYQEGTGADVQPKPPYALEKIAESLLEPVILPQFKDKKSPIADTVNGIQTADNVQDGENNIHDLHLGPPTGNVAAPIGVNAAAANDMGTLNGKETVLGGVEAPSGIAAQSGEMAAQSSVVAAPSGVVAAPSGVVAAPSGVVAAPSNAVGVPNPIVGVSGDPQDAVVATGNTMQNAPKPVADTTNRTSSFVNNTRIENNPIPALNNTGTSLLLPVVNNTRTDNSSLPFTNNTGLNNTLAPAVANSIITINNTVVNETMKTDGNISKTAVATVQDDGHVNLEEAGKWKETGNESWWQPEKVSQEESDETMGAQGTDDLQDKVYADKDADNNWWTDEEEEGDNEDDEEEEDDWWKDEYDDWILDDDDDDWLDGGNWDEDDDDSDDEDSYEITSQSTLPTLHTGWFKATNGKVDSSSDGTEEDSEDEDKSVQAGKDLMESAHSFDSNVGAFGGAKVSSKGDLSSTSFYSWTLLLSICVVLIGLFIFWNRHKVEKYIVSLRNPTPSGQSEPPKGEEGKNLLDNEYA